MGHEVTVAFVPEVPLRVGGLKPGGQFLEPLDYIPGSVLRGALAEYLLQEGREDEIIAFTSRIRFGNLFPCPDEGDAQGLLALPFPLTAMQCKRRPGFRTSGRKEEGHGVVDVLIASLAYAEMERQGARFPVPFVLRCRHPECGKDKNGRPGRLEPVGGFYAYDERRRERVSLRHSVQTKVALSRLRGAAQEGMLYRVVALSPGVSFVGRLWVEDEEVLRLLREAVAACGLGALTTRGYGQGRLEERQVSLPPLAQRVADFNARLRQAWEELASIAKDGAPEPPQEATYFSVDLLAPALIVDEHGIPTLELSLDLGGRRLMPAYWAARPAFVGGWSTAWGLPKPTAPAACRGSTYVFRIDAPLDDVLPELEPLERSGVGERADEGLGEVLVCHPFHLEVSQV